MPRKCRCKYCLAFADKDGNLKKSVIQLMAASMVLLSLYAAYVITEVNFGPLF